MKPYDHKKIEKKWQKRWEQEGIFKASSNSKKKKFYSLIEFPYPSGEGLHVGHVRSNTAMDIISRKRRMEGYNVLYPIGWDAFGLPTENYAIKTSTSPQIVTKRNTDNFRRQLKSIGFSFDWSREINTTDPKYYKWTQWIFLQMYKKGLAYKKKMSINWCPKDKVGLANEEVINGCCERCGTPVEKREKEQWMLAITKYADRLDKDLDLVDYPNKVKTQQRNWIGKSHGAEIDFEIKEIKQKVKVFTTRPDTIFGVTYLVLAPEHKLISEIKDKIENWDEVKKYIDIVSKKTEIDRTDQKKEKTGIILKGIKAINPSNKEEIPVWIADYVLAEYGTGAVMAVPAHDERDFDFAKKYNLSIKEVIIPRLIDHTNPPVENQKTVCRDMVHAIVYDPKNKKFLTLKWKKHPWHTIVLGGIDAGEDAISAAIREVKEETGYSDLKFIKVLGGRVQALYNASHKGENRIATTTGILFELQSKKQEEIDQDEKDSFDIYWMPKEDFINQTLTNSELVFWKERLNKTNFAYAGNGIMVNSDKFDDKNSEETKDEIVQYIKGRNVVTFKLRDWVFSRQRYWGEPIPLINCQKCGIVPVPEKDLPLELPNVKNYQPTDTGESPLASISKWVNTKCPKCKGKAKRETDTMPQWAGSSWYYLRYTDPKNNKVLADKKNLKYFTPVDWYNGGMEHTTLHLLYSRFWHKFLYDLKIVPTKEPYSKRTSHGMILANGGEKMSKSKGNVVNPDSIVDLYGADSLRLYEMFMGPFDQAISWSDENIIGVRRFIERIWKIGQTYDFTKKTPKNIESILHKTIKKVTEDIESMSFNTAISSMMIFINDLEKEKNISKKDFYLFLSILSPFAPHLSEELWSNLGEKKMLALEKWPKAKSVKIEDSKVQISVQINGKFRAKVDISKGATGQELEDAVKKIPEINKWLNNKNILKVIHIPGIIINFVTD